MKIKPLSYAVSAIMLSYISHVPLAQAAISSTANTNTQGQKLMSPILASQQPSEPNPTLNLVSIPTAIFETITVASSSKHVPTGLAFDNTQKASDVIINKEKLQQRSATLGNALADELGVHSNPFGGGSSTPVIRGQEGVRVKILQNGLDAIDMSTLSPDHAVGVDTLLADRVELIRGASTLLYSTASPAGVINVVDGRIPTEVPEDYNGEAALRFNENNDERVATAGVTFGLTDRVALRVEGLTRKANNYEVPEIKLGEPLNYLPDSHNKSNVGTVGLSYIGDSGHIGVAYSQREDNYGLVGHNHKFDECSGHVVYPQGIGKNRPYLNAYPHLMGDDDLADSFHFHCGTDHDLDAPHSHDNPYGHNHDHTQGGPWVDMKSKSYYLQGELLDPIPSIEKVRLNVAYHDYHHEEHDHGKTLPDSSKPDGSVFIKANPSYFDNQGYNAKLEAYHTPTENLQGVWGIQSQSHKSSALIPSKQERTENRRLLVENKHQQFSLFGVEQYKLNDWLFETGLRYEQSKIPVTYDMGEIEAQNKRHSQLSIPEQPDLTPYKESAFSYALGYIWDITPEYRLDMSYSHNERLPTPMELYYHGKNLATNSFLYGNKDLNKEESDNFELGLQFTGDKWHYKASAYSNHFDNYVHAENLHKDGNLYMRRMTQSKAKIKGLEAEVRYEYLPGHSATLFGDYVRGKLYGFAPIYGNNIYDEVTKYMPPEECGATPNDPDYEEWCGYPDYELVGVDKVDRPQRNAPRMSPMRLGFRLNNDYNNNWSTSLDFTRVFAQNKTSTAIIANIPREETRLKVVEIPEEATSGYSLLNVGVDYKNTWHNGKHPLDYTVSLRANNLLNEDIYVHNSFLPFVPQMGRNVSLGFNVLF
ncbi:TonB-dependent receptor [Psychrobacter sanguinis]|uniref:TonB-dependent receptor n=1 Tax=Psychrobacter sanguinis TaxID=861445 RepID=UPI0019186A52|nr:TonB-dependent receptor [Psychrobacter sanguinis]MCC3344703.1 TonB-dependent receptor [Psychrobacter sanguinis]